MDAKFKEKWIKALRSGEYRQGREALRDSEDRFCCLGVACDVAGLRWSAHPQTDGKYAVLPYGVRLDLPSPFQKRIGLSQEDEGILIAMNDDGKRFSTIANWIEKNL